jgi:hypothetical protein
MGNEFQVEKRASRSAMSKNFELLQQISEEKKLYDTSTDGTNTKASNEAQHDSPVSEKHRREVLRTSTLPDVLKVVPDEPAKGVRSNAQD